MIDSFPSIKEAKEVTERIDLILKAGGFKIKEWLIAGMSRNSADMSKNSVVKNSDDGVDGMLNQRLKVLGVI